MNNILTIVSFMYTSYSSFFIPINRLYIYIIIIVFIPIDEIILAIKRHVGDGLSGFNPRYNNFPFEL